MTDVLITGLPEAPEGWEYSGLIRLPKVSERVVFKLLSSCALAISDERMSGDRDPPSYYHGPILIKKVRIIDIEAYISKGRYDIECFCHGSGRQIHKASDLHPRPPCNGNPRWVADGKPNSPFIRAIVREGIKFVHNESSESPVPDGLYVRILASPRNVVTMDSGKVNWSGVSWFEVIGKADGWKYEWED